MIEAQEPTQGWPGAAVSDSAKPLPLQVEAVATLARQAAFAQALYDSFEFTRQRAALLSATEVNRALSRLPIGAIGTFRGVNEAQVNGYCADLFTAYAQAAEQVAAAIDSIDVFCNSVYRDALYALQATAYNAEEATR